MFVDSCDGGSCGAMIAGVALGPTTFDDDFIFAEAQTYDEESLVVDSADL